MDIEPQADIGFQGTQNIMGTGDELRATLRRIDGAGYKAYNDIVGGWNFGQGFTLFVDRIQADPFAPPSRCHLRVPQSVAKFPPDLYNNAARRVALCDFLTRGFCGIVKKGGLDQAAGGGGWSGAKGGDLQMDTPGQQVLERTSVLVSAEFVEARFTVALPAAGRSILGQKATQILVEALPSVVQSALLFAALPEAQLRKHINTVEDTRALRSMLAQRQLVAFVGDGAILPRASGHTDVPMDANKAVRFESPPSLRVSFDLPHAGTVTGMGIPAGITLIVGGGFHGKSTLLQALQVGVYDHVPGDGRELVVADPAAITIRAEDGRSVERVDIRPFISNLPFGKTTDDFSTPDASGSTSQAANIIEGLEVGAKVLLVDEDTAATNFMVRDERMIKLVAADKEPIVPFIHKVKAIYSEIGVSSVLVIGGCGDYFDVADLVIMQENYGTRDVTAEARALARPDPISLPFGTLRARVPLREGLQARREDGGKEKVSIGGQHEIRFGDNNIDLSSVHQIVDKSQTRAIGDALLCMRDTLIDGKASMEEILMRLTQRMDTEGLDALAPNRYVGNYARPRHFEVAMALNRLRGAQFQQR